jgi:PTS system nitrogen regulatory IIA component
MEISDFLAPSQVVINRHASDKGHLLDHLARRAAVALDLPYEMILSALLKREELGSTGTGDGVAVPHARLLGVSKPFGMLACLSEAIDFDAIDGEPVDIVCVLLLPTNSDEGQHALACAARVLRDPEALRNIRQAADTTEAYRALVGQRSA